MNSDGVLDSQGVAAGSSAISQTHEQICEFFLVLMLRLQRVLRNQLVMLTESAKACALD